MNLAQPPFDDVHVRRAANLVIARRALVERFGPGGARLAVHAAPDSLEGNLLLDYDPYPTPGGGGDLAAARAEMAQSRYDSDGDEPATKPASRRSPRSRSTTSPPSSPRTSSCCWSKTSSSSARARRPEAHRRRRSSLLWARQESRHALILNYVWAKDFPNGSGWFPGALGVDDPTGNPSLVGVSAEQLAEWGYPVTDVPSVGDEIAECVQLVGGAQTQCWAELDQLVMEQIVPWIPYAAPNKARTFSTRVVSVSIDQFVNYPALDRIALEPG